MPELPEVETVVRGLRKIIVGSTIKSVTLNAPPKSTVVSKQIKPSRFDKALEGKQVLAVNRRGKNILIQLSDEMTLWVHLKMTGKFHQQTQSVLEKHDLVLFEFDKTKNKLVFNDFRRFGRLRLFRNDELWEQDGLRELGPEPLEITEDEFVRLAKRTSRMIKPALLDQSFIAGIGNIYADESLYLSKIHPKKSTSKIAPKKLRELHSHIQSILKFSIRNMGTTADNYSGVNGQPGKFQHYLKVYNNEGEPCERCDRPIIREKIGSRSAHYCRYCQRV